MDCFANKHRGCDHHCSAYAESAEGGVGECRLIVCVQQVGSAAAAVTGWLTYGKKKTVYPTSAEPPEVKT